MPRAKYVYNADERCRALVLAVLEAIPSNSVHDRLDEIGALQNLRQRKRMQRAIRTILQMSPNDVLERLEYGIKERTQPVRLAFDRNGEWHDFIKASRLDVVAKEINPTLTPILNCGDLLEIEAVCFGFEAKPSIEEAIEIIEKRGWRLADLSVLLAFAAKQRKLKPNKVIAAGQPISSFDFLPQRIVESDKRLGHAPFKSFPLTKTENEKPGGRRVLTTECFLRQGLRRDEWLLAYR